jgi:hypothetical protein
MKNNDIIPTTNLILSDGILIILILIPRDYIVVLSKLSGSICTKLNKPPAQYSFAYTEQI